VASKPPNERREALVSVYREMCDSHACPLKDTRTKLVFGAGNANADLMLVGEAPGASEDKQGLPFVGRAGKLLDELLAEQGIQRSDVFITNVICCRPPGNRDPLPDEIEACNPYLNKKIELIEPKVICTLGNFATKLLTGNPTGITKIHGRPQEREVAGRVVLLFPIFHPAAALRTDSVKQLLRDDFAKLPPLLAKHTEEKAQSGDADELDLFK
jgi:uracil-DNA glycosylase